MALSDVGITLKVASTANTRPESSSGYTISLPGCTAMPAFIQPANKLDTTAIGDEYTSEISGKKVATGYDFTFIYEEDLFTKLLGYDTGKELRWVCVTLPSGRTFEWLAQFSVATEAVSPDAVITFVCAINPQRNTVGTIVITTAPTQEEV